MRETINAEAKKIISQLKAKQKDFQKALDHDWLGDVRRLAEKQSKEVQKLFRADAKKLKAFIERQKKELAKAQKEIPKEVKKVRKFVDSQKREIDKLLTKAKRAAKTGKLPKTKKKASKAKASKKPVSRSKKVSSPKRKTQKN